MSTFAEQLQAFAKANGGTLRYGPQPPKPAPRIAPGIGPSENPRPVKPKAWQAKPASDPWIDYTDDYTVWKQGQ